MLVCGAELLPKNWSLVVGLLRFGGVLLILLTIAGSIVVAIATGGLTSW